MRNLRCKRARTNNVAVKRATPFDGVGPSNTDARINLHNRKRYASINRDRQWRGKRPDRLEIFYNYTRDLVEMQLENIPCLQDAQKYILHLDFIKNSHQQL